MGNSKKEVSHYNYGSFVKEARDRVMHPNCKQNEGRENSHSFTETHSFDEAMSFAINGWDLGLEQYVIEDGTLVNGSTELHPSLSGCIPHVQNYISDFPEQMYALYDTREYNLPTLDIVVNLTYHGGMGGDEALEFGKSLVGYVNAMASKYNIRLTGIFAQDCYESNLDAYYIITLKDFDTPLVLNNIAFAFHPSFFRRLWFSVFEGKEYWQYGYGRPISNIKKVAKENLTGSEADKTVFFKSLQDLSRFSFDPDDISRVTY